MTGALPERVLIRDVGPRDGLQSERPVAPERRVELVESLVAAGLGAIEIAAFVSPRAVPSMADAATVVAGVPAREGLVRTALVPNIRGARDALLAGVDELSVTISVSETYNRDNVGMSTDDSLAEIGTINDLAAAEAVPVDVVVSCAFGSPYGEGIVPGDVRALVSRLRDVGVGTITHADTTGMATPRRIDDLLDGLDEEPRHIGLHLHDTRGLALANAHAALLRGVRRFDTSVGGFGGSPFARGAGGNLATESLVVVCDDLGIETGIDITRLLDAAELIAELAGRPAPSMIAAHGPPRAGAGTAQER